MNPLARLRRAFRGTPRHRIVTVQGGPAAGLVLDLSGASADYEAGTNELPVQQALATRLRRGDTFVDVGANVGFFSLLAARLVGPTGRVVAIEALGPAADVIEANAARNGLSVEVLRLAVGDGRADTIGLWTTRHPGGAATEAGDRPPDVTGRVDVPASSLDQLLVGGRLAPPTLVKIDVEGAELAVLAGARQLLREGRPTLLIELDGPTPEVVAAKRATLDERLAAVRYRTETLPEAYAGVGWCVQHLVAQADKDGF